MIVIFVHRTALDAQAVVLRQETNTFRGQVVCQTEPGGAALA